MGDNSGSTDLIQALQGAFANNWGSINAPGTGAREKKKKTAKEMVVVLDDDEDKDGEEKSKVPTSLEQALAATFMHNSVDPNVAALTSASAPAPASGSMRRLAKATRADTFSDSPSIEVLNPSTTKRTRTQAHLSNSNKRSPACVGA